MAFPARWKELLREERARVPAGSKFGAYAAATKRASARYHGKSEGRSSGGRRSNPTNNTLKWVVGIGLALWLGPKVLAGINPKTPAPAALQPAP